MNPQNSMAKLSLKNILSKDIDSINIVTSLAEQLGATISIEDNNGKNLFSNGTASAPFQFPVLFENETLGWVKGNEKGSAVAKILSHLISKETSSLIFLIN